MSGLGHGSLTSSFSPPVSRLEFSPTSWPAAAADRSSTAPHTRNSSTGRPLTSSSSPSVPTCDTRSARFLRGYPRYPRTLRELTAALPRHATRPGTRWLEVERAVYVHALQGVDAVPRDGKLTCPFHRPAPEPLGLPDRGAGMVALLVSPRRVDLRDAGVLGSSGPLGEGTGGLELYATPRLARGRPMSLRLWLCLHVRRDPLGTADI